MIRWRKQGAACLGAVRLTDGSTANVVIVGPRENRKGAALVVPSEDGGAPKTHLLSDVLDRLYPGQVTAVLCIQERMFGHHGLPPAEVPEAKPAS